MGKALERHLDGTGGLVPWLIDQEVVYLDLRGDGVPDAVLTMETWAFDGDGKNYATVSRLESDIGDDGVPRRSRIVAGSVGERLLDLAEVS
jgi:hypothetical protein